MATAKKQSITIADGSIVCTYATIGKTFRGVLATLPASVYVKCEASDHGMEQKLGDAKSGKSPAEKFAEVQKIWASLLAGKWNRTESEEERATRLEAKAEEYRQEVFAAIARIKRVPLDKVVEAGKAAGLETVDGWGKTPEVEAMILKTRAEQAQAAAKGSKLGAIAGIDA